MNKTVAVVLAVLVVAVGAVVVIQNNNSNNTPGAGNNNQSGNPLTVSYTRDELKEMDDKSCDLLSMEMVKEYAGNSVSESDIDQATYWGCIYEWEKSNKAEIEEFNSKVVNDAFANGIGIMEASKNFKSAQNKLSFSVDTYSPSNTPELLDRSYRTSIGRLTDEEKQQNDALLDQVFENTSQEANLSEGDSQIGDLITDIIVNEQNNTVFVDVNGVGDRAAWSDYSKTLVVVHKNAIMTFEVDLDNSDKNQDIAKEIANKIIAKI